MISSKIYPWKFSSVSVAAFVSQFFLIQTTTIKDKASDQTMQDEMQIKLFWNSFSMLITFWIHSYLTITNFLIT